MKKEDLQSGMILEIKEINSDIIFKGLIVDNEIFFLRENDFQGSLSISQLSDKFILNKLYLVLKVFKPTTPKNTNIGVGLKEFILEKYSNKYLELIWERQEKKTITIEKWLVLCRLSNTHTVFEMEDINILMGTHDKIKLLDTYEVEL